jgi:hypothetical protein
MTAVILTPSATARLIEKSEGWVRYAAATGKLPCIVTTTGRRLFKQSDVLALKQKLGEQPSQASTLKIKKGPLARRPRKVRASNNVRVKSYDWTQQIKAETSTPTN